MAKAKNVKKRVSPGKENRNGPAGRNAAEQSEADCRCKEAKGKSMGELLKVVVKDLTFWRK